MLIEPYLFFEIEGFFSKFVRRIFKIYLERFSKGLIPLHEKYRKINHLKELETLSNTEPVWEILEALSFIPCENFFWIIENYLSHSPNQNSIPHLILEQKFLAFVEIIDTSLGSCKTIKISSLASKNINLVSKFLKGRPSSNFLWRNVSEEFYAFLHGTFKSMLTTHEAAREDRLETLSIRTE